MDPMGLFGDSLQGTNISLGGGTSRKSAGSEGDILVSRRVS